MKRQATRSASIADDPEIRLRTRAQKPSRIVLGFLRQAVSATEFIDSATGIDDLLLARIERVTG
jgi:hypothetical protein